MNAYGFSSLLLLTTASRANALPWNIVLLLVDDMGWTGPGCYGSDLHETPAIDRFAASGMKFTSAYAAAPVCTPTRASIMTGKSPARLHMTIWRESARNQVFDRRLLPPDTRADLPQVEVTIAEVLRQAGYVTAHLGKWHLGGAASVLPSTSSRLSSLTCPSLTIVTSMLLGSYDDRTVRGLREF